MAKLTRNQEILAKINAAEAYFDAEMAQLKATIPPEHAPEPQASVLGRFEALYSDYLVKVRSISAPQWVRHVVNFITGFAIGAGIGFLADMAISAIIAACGVNPLGWVAIVISLIGFAIAILAVYFVSNALDGRYNAKIASAWRSVTSVFDRRIIVLGGAA